MTIPRSHSRRCQILLLLVIVTLAFLRGSYPHAVQAQSADDAFVERVLASLTPDERVGQLVMVNFVGDDVSAASDIAALMRDYNVGAVLVTASNGNIVNRDDTAGQLAALTNGLQQRAYDATHRSDAGSEYFLPLYIATDNEGDLFPFTNVTHGYTQVPNNMTIGATWSKKHAEATGAIVGKELSAAGINMLLGPVVDVLGNPRSGGNGDIGIRSLGGDAAWVGELGRAYVRGVHTGSGGRMLTVVKHFPGHGGSDRGTDNEVPTVNKSLDQLRASDLAPFAEADRADDADPLGTTDAMMVSHIRYRNFVAGAFAPFTGPISIDGPAFQALMDLPEFATWRAPHLVMSDSLGVPAVKQWYAQQEGQPDFPNRSIVRDALLAGNDLLPLVEFYKDPAHPGWKDNQLPLIEDSITYMRQQYASDPDFRRRADEAVRRVIAAKVKLYPRLQLSQVRVDAAAASAAAGSGTEEVRALADDALTLLQPQSVDALRSRLPRGPVTPDKVLIIECWEDCYPYRVMPKPALQNELLALYGPTGKGRLRNEDVATISYAELDAWLSAPADPANAQTAKAVNDASWVILALTEYNPVGRPLSGAVKRLLDSSPIDLNKTDAAIDAGFRALFGDATPKGRSPVNVTGIFYNVEDAVQPDASQQISVAVFGQQPDSVQDARTLGLVAGPITDRNGNPVPDGTVVSFELAHTDGATFTGKGATSGGLAGAQLSLAGPGSYVATARVAGIASKPFAITVAGAAVEPQATPESAAPGPLSSGGGGSSALLLALAIGIPSALGLAVAGALGATLYRRRSRATAAAADSNTGAPPPLAVAAEPPALRVDAETRRVYVKGAEMRPALSGEQFRLLSYLYQHVGKVVAREDLVLQVWPDAHAEGVSEEALDALVRRVRERIAQAGGERSYIVTLRGQGFRLDASTV